MARDKRGGRRPYETGPRLYRRGRWWAADLRPWGGPRLTLRNPNAAGWPTGGERTDDVEVARRWSWAYVDLYRDAIRARQLGIRVRTKSLDELRDPYLEHRFNTVAPNTVQGDRTLLTHLRDFFGGGVRPAELTADELQAFFDTRARDGYAPGTLRTLRHSLGALFQWLGADARILQALKLPEPARTEDVRVFTDGELARIREAADAVDRSRRHEPPSARRMVELLLATGCRQQEAFALEWRDMHPQHRTVRIARQLDRQGVRVVPLKGKLARTALVLPEWWDFHDASLSGPVLAREDGSRLTYRPQANLMRRVLDTAKIHDPGVRFHAFRHTYARLFIERGGRFEELQKSLGHASIRTTEGAYGHFHADVAATLAASRIYPSGGLRAV